MAGPKLKSENKTFNRIKKIFIAALFLFLPVLVYKYVFDLHGNRFLKIEIGNEEFIAEVADTMPKRMQGLSGRNDLGEKEGMLFIFNKQKYYGFWMKDMQFPIDIVWIRDNQVIGVSKNIEPDSYPTAYYPPSPVDKVFEMSAGSVDKFGIWPANDVSVKIDN